jgi:HNH endonuclease
VSVTHGEMHGVMEGDHARTPCIFAAYSHSVSKHPLTAEEKRERKRAYEAARYRPKPRTLLTPEEKAERNRATARKWYAAHHQSKPPRPDHAKARAWYAAHRAEFGPRMRDYMRDRHATQPAEWRDQQYRQKGTALCEHPDCLSIGPVALLLRVTAPRCYLCGMALSPSIGRGEPGHMQVDHVVPRSRGGRHCVENIRLACEPCNRWKGASLLPDLDGRLTLGLA